MPMTKTFLLACLLITPLAFAEDPGTVTGTDSGPSLASGYDEGGRSGGLLGNQSLSLQMNMGFGGMSAMSVMAGEPMKLSTKDAFSYESVEERVARKNAEKYQLHMDPELQAKMFATFGQVYGFKSCDPSFSIPLEKNWRDYMQDWNQQQCFKARDVTADTADEEEGLVFEDRKWCKCVREMPANHQAWNELKAKVKTPAEIVLDDVSTNIKIKMDEINTDFSSLMLQASSLGGAGADSKDLANNYTQELPSEAMAAEARAKLSTEVQAKIKDFKDPAGQKKIPSVVAQLVKPETADKAIARMEASSDGCYSMQAYLKDKQTSPSPWFDQGFAATNGEFNEADWNYDQIKKDLDEVVKVPETSSNFVEIEVKRQNLTARLAFLIANPLIKSIFAATPELVKKQVSKEDLHKSKKALYEIMKNKYYDPDGKQNTVEARSKALERYNEELRGYFSGKEGEKNPHLYIARMQAEADLRKNYTDPDALKRLLRPALHDANFSSIQTKFMAKYPGLDPSECKGDVKDMEKCVTIFTQYCPMVEDAAATLEERAHMEKNSPSDLIEAQQKQAVILDPKKNREYQHRHEQLCKSPRRSADGKSRLAFPAYKAANCKGLDGDACTSAFLAAYPVDDISEDPEYDILRSSNSAFAAKAAAKTKVTSKEAQEMSGNVTSASDSYTASPRTYSKRREAQAALQSLADAGQKIPTAAPASLTSDAATKKSSDVIAPPASPLLPPTVTAKTPVPDLMKGRDEVVREKEKIAAEKKEVARKIEDIPNKNSEKRKALESRLSDLEGLLKGQDDKIAEYQRLINERELADAEEEENEASPKKGKASSKGASYVAKASADVSRGPASMGAPTPAPGSGSTAGAGASSSTVSAASAARMNTSLKKVDVEVPAGTKITGSIIIAPADPKSFAKLEKAAGNSSYPLDVSADQYALFQSSDPVTLGKLYQEKLKDINQTVIQIVVTSKGQKPLRFFAIKEDGKVVIQPVRNHTLKGVHQAIEEAKS